MLLIDVIKPSDFALPDQLICKPLIGSRMRNREMEIVAANVITLCLRRGGEWKPFTWDDYRATLDHLKEHDSPAECAILHALAGKGYLDERDGVFAVRSRFLAMFAEFLICGEAA